MTSRMFRVVVLIVLLLVAVAVWAKAQTKLKPEQEQFVIKPSNETDNWLEIIEHQSGTKIHDDRGFIVKEASSGTSGSFLTQRIDLKKSRFVPSREHHQPFGGIDHLHFLPRTPVSHGKIRLGNDPLPFSYSPPWYIDRDGWIAEGWGDPLQGKGQTRLVIPNNVSLGIDPLDEERWKHSPDNPRSIKESRSILEQCKAGNYYLADELWETCVSLKLISPHELGTTQSRLEWYRKQFFWGEAIRIRNALEAGDPRTHPSELDPYMYLGRFTLADLDITPEQAKQWRVSDPLFPSSSKDKKSSTSHKFYTTPLGGFFSTVTIPQNPRPGQFREVPREPKRTERERAAILARQLLHRFIDIRDERAVMEWPQFQDLMRRWGFGLPDVDEEDWYAINQFRREYELKKPRNQRPVRWWLDK